MKFSDLATNTVYFSEFFKLRFPKVFEPSKTNLEANGVKVETIGQNQNIWIRDWGLIQVGNKLVRFGYKGYNANGIDEGYSEYPWLQIPRACYEELSKSLNIEIVDSEIILDGGGIIRNEKYSIITKKVFRSNGVGHATSSQEIVASLESLLQTKVIIIDVEPGDQLGHSDGICKFIDDENRILVNDYSSMKDNKELPWKAFAVKLYDTLQKAGLEITLMPYAYEKCPQYWDDEEKFYELYPFADDLNPAVGYYVNFLLTKSVVLAPVFGGDLEEKDQEAIAMLKRCYPHHSVIAINERELSMEGGLSNCTTQNYIKE
jgi:agmatine/peptidylarginine deiminase